MAETGHRPDRLKITRAEEGHFENIFSIDRFLRSWLGDAGPAAFDRYCTHAPLLESPIRTIRGHWTGRYTEGDEIRKMRRFLEKAASLTDSSHPRDGVFANAGEILGDLLKLPSDHLCFANRTHFRTHLKNLGIPEMSDTFRVLIELVDGHYIRTQYTELSHSAREITSPASQSKASQLGETWATRTMQACLRSSAAIRPWQFINRIQAAPLKSAVKLDLDRIALRFADFVSDTDRLHELEEYRHLLALARAAQGIDGGTNEDARKKFDALLTNVSTCIDKINTHMAGTGTEFHFNVNDEATCAGSLSLTFAGNESVSQCTGPRDSLDAARPQRLGTNASEGSNNCFPDAEV